jgi:hypothetical protein
VVSFVGGSGLNISTSVEEMCEGGRLHFENIDLFTGLIWEMFSNPGREAIIMNGFGCFPHKWRNDASEYASDHLRCSVGQ